MLLQLGHDVGSLGVALRGYDPGDLRRVIFSGTATGMGRPRWAAAFKLYEDDRVADALKLGSSGGAGDIGEYAEALTVIDAEARTSEFSDITRVSDWLEIEQIQSEQAMSAEEVGAIAEAAIRKVWARIGLRPGVNTLITLLRRDVVLPAIVEKTGYVTPKKPYAKYCLPGGTDDDPELLDRQIQRLAACHAAAILSNSMAPPWLIAAAEAVAEIPVSNEEKYAFCSGAIKWREPGALNVRLRGMELGGNPVDSASFALNQAILVGKYLLDQHDIRGFRDLLTYHSPTSPFQYMRLVLSNDPTRDACKKIYGFAPEYLFEQALAATCK